MNVDVVLLGLYRAYLPVGAGGDTVRLDFTADAVPLRDVVRQLRIPDDVVRVVFLRGEAIADDHLLHDGDLVTFASPIGGG
jgi:hypothetical protein